MRRFIAHSFFDFAVLSHYDRHMDRLLRHRVHVSDVAEAHQSVAAQDVRQGANVVRNESEEA